MCDKTVPGYVIYGYWQYFAQMVMFCDDKNKMEYAIGYPVKH